MVRQDNLAARSTTEEDLGKLSAIEILQSMAGRWTGWFDEYGGIDAYHAESRGHHDGNEEAEPAA